MDNVLMKCGHIAQGYNTETGKPFCVICNCSEVGDKDTVDLKSRIARCNTCGFETPSSFKLPFFCYAPEKAYDTYYCGCKGWN